MNMSADTLEPANNDEFSRNMPELSRYIPLHQAAIRGDWESAQSFFQEDEGAVTAIIKDFNETALHVAVCAGRSKRSINFLRNLVDKMPQEALEIANQIGNTALHIAALVGNVEAVKIICKEKKGLPSVFIRGQDGFSPLDLAASNAMKDTLLYLLDVIKNEPFSKLFPVQEYAARLLICVITSGYYDIALYLVEKYPDLAVSKQKDGDCGLKALARNVSAFKSGDCHKWWQRVIYDYVPEKLKYVPRSQGRRDIETLMHEAQVTGQQVTGRQSQGRRDIETLMHEAQVTGQQVTGQKCNWARPLVEYFCNWARLLVEYFCISVPWIKHIQERKEMHLQALELLKCLCERVRSVNNSSLHWSFLAKAMTSAANLGINEVVEEIAELFPIYPVEKGLNLLPRAVIKRQTNVFNLIYQMGDIRHIMMSCKDGSGNNLLHLVARRAPPNKLNQVAGAALQMQRELQWFMEVKKLAKPADEECRNSQDLTPKMLFTEEHEKLVAEGEKWMKDTANSCTIPSALIITMVFAAAITVPGGIKDTDSLPNFSKEVAFKIFVFSDAISLFAATTSLLVVLSILTSRYAEDDFLFALPNRLIIGLATLFLSITAMVIAFSSALYLLFGNNDRVWIVYPVVVLALTPIFSFTFLQFPLLLDLISSTYCPRIFGKQSNRPFYGDGT